MLAGQAAQTRLQYAEGAVAIAGEVHPQLLTEVQSNLGYYQRFLGSDVAAVEASRWCTMMFSHLTDHFSGCTANCASMCFEICCVGALYMSCTSVHCTSLFLVPYRQQLSKRVEQE
jgi:hypothetical protein